MKLTHYLRAAALIAPIFPLTAAAQTRTLQAAFQNQTEHPQAMGARQLMIVDSEPNRATNCGSRRWCISRSKLSC